MRLFLLEKEDGDLLFSNADDSEEENSVKSLTIVFFCCNPLAIVAISFVAISFVAITLLISVFYVRVLNYGK